MSDFKLFTQTPANGAITGLEGEFRLEDFRINQDFAERLTGRRKAVLIPVKKPDRQVWVCLHPDPEWRIQVGLLEDRINQRSYLVAPDLLPEVSGDVVPKILICYATRHGSVGLWPIRLPGEDGRLDSFNESALSIVKEHAGKWIRILLNTPDRTYEVYEGGGVNWPAPKWPEGGFNDILEMAFKSRVVRTLNHPLLRALRGEADESVRS